MGYISEGFREAIRLLISFDKEIYSIVFLSLFVSTTATIIASIICVPLGIHLGIKDFKDILKADTIAVGELRILKGRGFFLEYYMLL